jgi:hypothetical protein
MKYIFFLVFQMLAHAAVLTFIHKVGQGDSHHGGAKRQFDGTTVVKLHQYVLENPQSTLKKMLLHLSTECGYNSSISTIWKIIHTELNMTWKVAKFVHQKSQLPVNVDWRQAYQQVVRDLVSFQPWRLLVWVVKKKN